MKYPRQDNEVHLHRHPTGNTPATVTSRGHVVNETDSSAHYHHHEDLHHHNQSSILRMSDDFLPHETGNHHIIHLHSGNTSPDAALPLMATANNTTSFHRSHRRHNSLLRLPSFKRSFVNLITPASSHSGGTSRSGETVSLAASTSSNNNNACRSEDNKKCNGMSGVGGNGGSALHQVKSSSTMSLLSAAAGAVASTASAAVASAATPISSAEELLLGGKSSRGSGGGNGVMSALQRCACVHVPKVAFFCLIGSVILLYFFLGPTFSCSGHTQHMPGNEQSVAFYTDDDSKLWFPPWNYISDEYITPEELEFPLAFSIIAYTDAKQVLMLLRSIYRKHNHYCIHLDANAAPDMRLLVHQTLADLPNLVFVTSPVHVIHSTFTVLEADLLCMRELLKAEKKWFYFINLTGQEYPRKTNLELVRILKTMNGSNLIHKDVLLWDRVMKRIWSDPPDGIKLWKGSVHIIVVREFVRFALYDRRSLGLLDYLKNTNIPDESFFSSLNHNLHLRAPGGYKGNETTGDSYPFINRLKVWWNEWHDIPCYGVYVRLICIFGEKNFPDLTNEDNPTLFINKFIVPINGRLLRRIDEWFLERQKRIYAGRQLINTTFYESRMPQRLNHF